MQNFIVGILTKVLSDPKVQTFIKNLLSDLITEKIAPLIPLAVGSAMHALEEKIPGVKEAEQIIGTAVDAAENIRQDLNTLIPDIDIGIPLIDNIIDAWRPR